MSTSKKIVLACDEATTVCDKNQYKEASGWEKIRLIVHLIYCRACRKYTTRNTKLTKVMKESNVRTFDKASKKEIEELLRKELSKQESS